MPDQTLPNGEPERQPYLYIDEQNILVQHAWQLFGCLAPFVVFWIGALIVGALAGW